MAIKVFKDRADQAARHRFKLEAHSAGDLKEIRQIVRVLDVEMEHQPPYFVMDYVPGERLDKVGQLAPRDAARIALEVANGLAGCTRRSGCTRTSSRKTSCAGRRRRQEILARATARTVRTVEGEGRPRR